MYLEFLLIIVTFGLGWLVWTTFFTARNGQTPAKQILHMRVLKKRTGRAAAWGQMFARDVVYKLAIAFAAGFTFGLGFILYFWLLWDQNNQELWDKMADTIVVDDPNDQLVNHRGH